MVHQYRADATNSAVWQKCKLHTTEIESAYTEPIFPHSTFQEVLDNMKEQKLLGDLQIVKDSTPAGTLGCLRKQLVRIKYY